MDTLTPFNPADQLYNRADINAALVASLQKQTAELKAAVAQLRESVLGPVESHGEAQREAN